MSCAEEDEDGAVERPAGGGAEVTNQSASQDLQGQSFTTVELLHSDHTGCREEDYPTGQDGEQLSQLR
ncbi:hypothetical protein Hamer_G021204 [Homarus americanus]|uniref:Uncharacterized protein n=1 Tax=Homarus americanus TaxID=6706 RepID=A0A8J5J9C5_HOMAM|nr:hypothetical protein Hamer_G021204 [Homarus americanus]